MFFGKNDASAKKPKPSDFGFFVKSIRRRRSAAAFVSGSKKLSAAEQIVHNLCGMARKYEIFCENICDSTGGGEFSCDVFQRDRLFRTRRGEEEAVCAVLLVKCILHMHPTKGLPTCPQEKWHFGSQVIHL